MSGTRRTSTQLTTLVCSTRRRWRPTRNSTLVASLATLVVLTAGCSSGGTGSTASTITLDTRTTSAPPSPSPSPASLQSPTTQPTGAASVDLSGTWAGQYNGPYTGSFALDWKQSGSKLSGSIALSAPAGTLSLKGTVDGTAIDFGTVGSTAITYTGTVSGDSMSGTYQVNGAGGGDWSATRS